MRDQAMRLKRELAQEKVELEQGSDKVIVAGDQTLISLTIGGQEQPQLVSLINQALQKSQKIAAQKLSQMGGGLAGLLGK